MAPAAFYSNRTFFGTPCMGNIPKVVRILLVDKRTHIEHCDYISHCPNHSFFLTAIVIIIVINVIITVQTGRSKTSMSRGRWLAPKLISSRQALINNKDTDTGTIWSITRILMHTELVLVLLILFRKKQASRTAGGEKLEIQRGRDTLLQY